MYAVNKVILQNFSFILQNFAVNQKMNCKLTNMSNNMKIYLLQRSQLGSQKKNV